jgi:hypothetical protein
MIKDMGLKNIPKISHVRTFLFLAEAIIAVGTNIAISTTSISKRLRRSMSSSPNVFAI